MAMTLAAAWSGLWLLMLGAGEVTLEEIHAKWRERTERSRGIRLTWDEERGSAKVTGIQFTLGQKPSQIRLDNETMSGGPTLPAVRYVSTCNDVDCRGYFPGPDGSGGGHIWPKSDLSLFQLPVVQALRPFESRLNDPALDKYVLTKFRAKVNGTECIVLEDPLGTQFSALQSQVWVDPERDFVPRKYVSKVDGKDGVWYVCDYENHATGVYLPSQWEAYFSEQEHFTARVTMIETDLSLAESEFTIEFPPDTNVADKVAGAEYYLDRSGKKTRGGAQAMRPPAQAAVNRQHAPWGALVAALATIGVIVVFLFRRRFSSE